MRRISGRWAFAALILMVTSGGAARAADAASLLTDIGGTMTCNAWQTLGDAGQRAYVEGLFEGVWLAATMASDEAIPGDNADSHVAQWEFSARVQNRAVLAGPRIDWYVGALAIACQEILALSPPLTRPARLRDAFLRVTVRIQQSRAAPAPSPTPARRAAPTEF